MPIDRSIIGEAAAKFLDTLEEKYGDEGSLSAVVIIVAVDHGAEGDGVEYEGYDGQGQGLSGWQAKGLLALVNDSIRPSS